MCHALTIEKIQAIDDKLFYRRYFLPCNSWGCEECAKTKAHKLAVKARKGFEGYKVRFVTLTAPTGLTIKQMLISLKASWNRLRTELTRGGKKLKYLWVLEAGEKKARPHLHILIDRYIPQQKLSVLAKRCGFGSIVDIRLVKSASVFNYVTKYLSKGIGSKTVELTLKHLNGRRYGCSRGFAPAPEKKDTGVTLRIDRPVSGFEHEVLKTKFYRQFGVSSKPIEIGRRTISICLGDVEPWMDEPAEIYANFLDGKLKVSDYFLQKDFEILYGAHTAKLYTEGDKCSHHPIC